MPNKGASYDAPIYNTPTKKQLRAASTRKNTTSPEQQDPQYIMQQWHEIMQKIQSERQEISALQEEADRKQAEADKQSLTPELKKLMDQVSDLKDDKADLDFDLARVRQKYTPEAKSDLDNEVMNLRRDFFIDTEALEQINDNISKMKEKSKDFYNQEPAKSVLEAEKRVTELTRKLNDLYRESAQIDVDFEETFNPTPGVKKENRKVTYLKRKLQLTEKESEKRLQEIQQMKKDHEKAKESLMAKMEEDERKKKFRAEMSKSRRRELIAQQCKAAGYDIDDNETKEEEHAKKNDEDSDLEKMLGLDYGILNPTRIRKRKKVSKKKKAAQKANENNKTMDNATTKKKSSIVTGNKGEKNEDNIFQNSKSTKKKKDSVKIDEEKDLVNIGQSGSEDSEVQIIDGNETGEITDKLINTNPKSKSKVNNIDEAGNADENEGENENINEENGEINNESENDNIDQKIKANENGEDQSDDEYDYIECKFNQVTLLDVSPESFSKSTTGNFSSMLSSGLGLINKQNDFQTEKIKIKKRQSNKDNLELWNSQESDPSTVDVEPLYDFQYNKDWKIVSKTLKQTGTKPLDALLKASDQSENSQNDEEETGEEGQKVNKTDKNSTRRTNTKNKTESKEAEDASNKEKNNEDSNNNTLENVLDKTNSLFGKEQNGTEEEENESTEKAENKETNKEEKENTENNEEENENENKENEDNENKDNEKEDKESEDKESEDKGNEDKEKEDKEKEDKEKEDKENEDKEKVDKENEVENETKKINKKENKVKGIENEEGTGENQENENSENENEKKDDDDDNVDILNGICGTSPNRGDVETPKEKPVFQVTVVADGFLREEPSESSDFDSIVLIDISPSPLFAKLSDVFKKKGIVSAGKFNYNI